MKLAFAIGFIATLCFISTSHAYEISFEEDRRLPVVYINVAIKGGAVTDPKNQTGLTNFMGEMLLRGTQTKSKEKIDRTLDQMGARLDVETRAEALIFRGAVLSSQLEPYLKLLSEILTQPSFPENEIKKLKSELHSIIQEELGRDSTLAARRFNQFLFQDHPYGKPILGRIRDIENLSKSGIIDQYNRLIQDPLLLVVGSGDTSSGKIEMWTKELAQNRPAAQLTASDKQLLQKVSPPKNTSHRRLLIIDKPERTQTQINLGQIGVLMTDPNYFPLHLGNYAFGGASFSSTLMVEIRVKKGWSYGANSAFRFGLQPRSWLVHLFPAAKDTPPALHETLSLIKNLQEQGIRQEKFDFAQRSLVNSAGFMYNTPQKRVENKLLEKTLDLPEGFMKSFGPELNQLTLSQVNEALKQFVKPDELAITVLGTAKDLKSKLAEASGVPENQVDVKPYTQD